MQLQIECNHALFQKERCLTCSSMFETTEAKVIVCSDQGKYYGEVCPECLKKGFDWLSDRFDQLSQPKKIDVIRHARTKIPLGA